MKQVRKGNETCFYVKTSGAQSHRCVCRRHMSFYQVVTADARL